MDEPPHYGEKVVALKRRSVPFASKLSKLALVIESHPTGAPCDHAVATNNLFLEGGTRDPNEVHHKKGLFRSVQTTLHNCCQTITERPDLWLAFDMERQNLRLSQMHTCFKLPTFGLL